MLTVYEIEKPVVIHEALAFEQALFSVYKKQENKKNKNHTILFWRAKDAVVCGRNQVPWQECNFSFMKKNNIAFARRDSGGGTVYHDLGNLNICVISDAPTKKWNPVKRNLDAMVKALKSSHDIQAKVSEQKDIFVPNEQVGKKITGSALRIMQDKVLHHFTLLLQADLEKAKKSLQIPEGFEVCSSSVKSRSRPITNIHCSTELIIDAYIKQFEAKTRLQAKKHKYAGINLAVKKTNTSKVYKENYSRLISEAWLYERSPKSEIVIPNKEEKNEIKVLINANKISHVEVKHFNSDGIINFTPIVDIYMNEKSLASACTQSEEHDIIKKAVHALYKAYYE